MSSRSVLQRSPFYSRIGKTNTPSIFARHGIWYSCGRGFPGPPLSLTRESLSRHLTLYAMRACTFDMWKYYILCMDPMRFHRRGIVLRVYCAYPFCVVPSFRGRIRYSRPTFRYVAQVTAWYCTPEYQNEFALKCLTSLQSIPSLPMVPVWRRT